MAWGGIYGDEKVVLDLDPSHKSYRNIKLNKSFTLSVADIPHIKEVDYFGMVSGNTVHDKFERTGLKAERSKLVNAPILVDFPLTAECEAIEIDQAGSHVHVVGRILNTIAHESLFDESGNVAPGKLQGFCYDVFHGDYYSNGERLGRAWSFGVELANKKPKEEYPDE